jgi:hypothetical protein
MRNDRTHHSKPDLHHGTEIRPMMLKGYRVDDGYAAGRGWRTKENAVDGLVRVFEGMKNDFGVGKVLEAKVWA